MANETKKKNRLRDPLIEAGLFLSDPVGRAKQVARNVAIDIARGKGIIPTVRGAVDRGGEFLEGAQEALSAPMSDLVYGRQPTEQSAQPAKPAPAAVGGGAAMQPTAAPRQDAAPYAGVADYNAGAFAASAGGSNLLGRVGGDTILQRPGGGSIRGKSDVVLPGQEDMTPPENRGFITPEGVASRGRFAGLQFLTGGSDTIKEAQKRYSERAQNLGPQRRIETPEQREAAAQRASAEKITGLQTQAQVDSAVAESVGRAAAGDEQAKLALREKYDRGQVYASLLRTYVGAIDFQTLLPEEQTAALNDARFKAQADTESVIGPQQTDANAADANGDGTTTPLELRIYKAEKVMAKVKRGEPVSDSLRQQAEAILKQKDAQVKAMAGTAQG